jgi:hypothetical protein
MSTASVDMLNYNAAIRLCQRKHATYRKDHKEKFSIRITFKQIKMAGITLTRLGSGISQKARKIQGNSDGIKLV